MAEKRTGPAVSVFNASKRLIATLLSAGEARLRLAVVELQEERDRFFSLLINTFVAVLLGLFGIGMVILWIVVYFWDTHRLLAIGCAAGVLLGLAIILAIRVKVLASRPTLLRTTLSLMSEDKSDIEEELDKHSMGRQLQRDKD
ncbi:hypothetical protein LMG33818_001296 [Halomonadaceae bacterium LMG 33818]|uniref:phage holin family protein n=1 Tax=Cernens ardua TaxID=3402176 RepID=UPI003EDBBD95